MRFSSSFGGVGGEVSFFSCSGYLSTSGVGSLGTSYSIFCYALSSGGEETLFSSGCCSSWDLMGSRVSSSSSFLSSTGVSCSYSLASSGYPYAGGSCKAPLTEASFDSSSSFFSSTGSSGFSFSCMLCSSSAFGTFSSLFFASSTTG